MYSLIYIEYLLSSETHFFPSPTFHSDKCYIMDSRKTFCRMLSVKMTSVRIIAVVIIVNIAFCFTRAVGTLI